jgi:uncharacterized membrane protein
MMTTTSDRLIREYLDELRAGTRDLPKRRREELLGEIESHIAEALPPEASEGEIRAVLDRLGDPAQIAAEERERLGIAPRRAGALEWVAVVLLLVGGIILPIVGWIVGVVLLWSSSVWTVRDKLIGTFVIPAGLLLPLGGLLVATTGQACRQVAGRVETCSGSHSFWGLFVPIVILVVTTVAPILAAIYLVRRARSASALEA